MKKYGRWDPVDYSRLQVYECLAYTQANDGKLEPRSKKRMILGYAHELKGYQL